MTYSYEQSIDIELPKTARIKQIVGVLLILFGLGFVLLASLYSYYFFIPVGVFVIAGALVTWNYNKTVLKYIYSYNGERIAFSTTNVVGKTERKLEILWADVDEYGDFLDLIDPRDFVMCANPRDYGVKTIEFHLENGEIHRVLFAPDDYMKALIDENVNYDRGKR